MACRPLAASVALVAVTGCADLSAPERVGAADQRQTVDQARGATCSTDVVKGLSLQIVAEANCLAPGAFVALPADPNVALGPAVFPYLEEPARDAFAAALEAQPGVAMMVNSMLRTVAQQYLLYAWYQNGQCSIPLAASPGSSNHESGLAFDVDQYAAWQTALEANGFSWAGASDPVHYDYVGPGAVDYRGTDVKAFQILWNKNNPTDLIAEDGAYGAQSEARLKQSPADGFPLGADCAPAAGAGPDIVPSISVDAKDTFADHASAGVPDLFEGDDYSVTMAALNRGGEAARVVVSVHLQDRNLASRSYVIESDLGHPGTFSKTGANDDPTNPSHDGSPGARFDLALGKLAPGETKRVTLRIVAKAYSIGSSDAPYVRFWVKDIPHHYHQDDYGEAPSMSKDQTFRGGKLQVALATDVYGRARWEWNSTRLEGWTATGDSTLVTDGATVLLIGSAGTDPGAQSPATSFPAERRTVTLRARRTGGVGSARLLFTTATDPKMGPDKAVAFNLPDDDAFHVVEVQAGAHAKWKGTITALRVQPFASGKGSADLDFVRVDGTGGAGGGTNGETGSGTGCACSVGAPAGDEGWAACALAALLAVAMRRRRPRLG